MGFTFFEMSERQICHQVRFSDESLWGSFRAGHSRSRLITRSRLDDSRFFKDKTMAAKGSCTIAVVTCQTSNYERFYLTRIFCARVRWGIQSTVVPTLLAILCFGISIIILHHLLGCIITDSYQLSNCKRQKACPKGFPVYDETL